MNNNASDNTKSRSESGIKPPFISSGVAHSHLDDFEEQLRSKLSDEGHDLKKYDAGNKGSGGDHLDLEPLHHQRRRLQGEVVRK